MTPGGGLVVYCTDVKRDLAGVDGALLEEVGAVHQDVARQLADGARSRLSADRGVGVDRLEGHHAEAGRR